MKKNIFLVLLFIPVFLFSIQLISSAWTLDACILREPLSDPNIDEGNSFTQIVEVTTSGSGGGWSAPQIHARYCTGSGCSSMGDIPASNGLSTATSNPQGCGNPCKNSVVNFTFTINGNTADDYVIDGRCESGIGDLNTVDQAVTVNSAGNTAPKWFDNSTDGTGAGTNVEHRVRWTDDTALSGYIFSFDNGTGTLVNDSFAEIIGTNNWSNVTKFVNLTGGSTIQWIVYANDSASLWNVTDTFQYTTTSVCDFAGTVKYSNGTAIEGAEVIIVNQSDNIVYFNFTSDASGDWSQTIEIAGNYTVFAYDSNVSLGGDVKPHIECDI